MVSRLFSTTCISGDFGQTISKKRKLSSFLYWHQIAKLTLTILLVPILGIFIPFWSSAQRIGEQAEMGRLEQQADDLIAQDDPEGAALAIGKAAMMADLLIQKRQASDAKSLFQAASFLYRGQELSLRALALFKQTGGIPPAPPGVCHYLFQGNQKLNRSKDLLQKIHSTSLEEIKIEQQNFFQKNEEWKNFVQDLYHEFECQGTQTEN